MVDTTNCLSKYRANLQDLELGTSPAVFFLRNTVCHNDLVESGSVDTFDGIAAEHAMRKQGIDVGGLLFL